MLSIFKIANKSSLNKRFYSKNINLKEKNFELRLPSGTVKGQDYFKGKKVVIVGVPGAFTPVCTASHVPGYAKNIDELKKKGIDEVVCVSVNDPFVMKAWGESMGVSDKVTMAADPFLDFTKTVEKSIDLSGPGLGNRSMRYCMVVDDGVVVEELVESSPSELKVSTAENLLTKL